MCGGFRHVVSRYYYGKSDRGVLPGIFEKYSLNTYPFWPQTLSFECKEVRKRKNEQCSPCPFCVRICFYREVGNYVIKKCDLSHEGHIVNGSSISTHAKTESDLTDDEKKQLATFGKMGSTGLNAKNGLVRLFLNRTYDSDLVYRFVRKHRILQSSHVTNKSAISKKKVNCNNCVTLLSIHDAGHRANSKDCPLNNTNWINKHWNQWQLQLSNEFGNINNNEYLNLVKYKIRECNKHEMIKFRNDLICFYSVHNSEITMVSNLYSYVILNII